MWQILKAEFQYTKNALILGYVIAAIFFTAAIVYDWGLFNYMWNTTVTYYILMWILGSQAIGEKRYRYYTALPVTPSDMALVDALYVLLVQAGMFLLWILFLLVHPQDATTESVWAMLTNNVVILSVITIFGIHYHLGFFGGRKYKLVNWCLLLLLVTIMFELQYFGKGRIVARFLFRQYTSAPGFAVALLLWIGLSLLSASLFARRKSYLA